MAEDAAPATAHDDRMDVETGRVANDKRRRVAFAGAEYIEYDLDAAPVVRRCGAHSTARSDADVALEWRARLLRRQVERIMTTGSHLAGRESDSDDDYAPDGWGRQRKPEPDAAAMRRRLEKEYEKEMRDAILERGFPVIDTAVVPLAVQFQASELLVAWSVVAPHAVDETDETEKTDRLDATASLETQRKHLELCRKQVFGPVVDGYAFGRRFFSIDSFLSLLELEELVALAEAHGLEVPALPADVLAKIKVTDRELISTYSPTGIGKPLKMLTFRELVEEAYARGILMEEERDGKNKKSKRAWVDVLRPALHAEMRAFKIREAHADLIHTFLATALEGKMRSARMETIVELINGYLNDHLEASATDDRPSEMAAVHRYFRALLEWHTAQPKTKAHVLSPPHVPTPPPTVTSPPLQPPVPIEPMSPIVATGFPSISFSAHRSFVYNWKRIPKAPLAHGRDAMTTSRSSSSMFSRPSSLGSPVPASISPPISPHSHMTATTSLPSAVTSATSSTTASPVSEDSDVPVITRRKSNNDKMFQRPSSTTALTASASALPPASTSSQRKLMRSPTADNIHQHQQQQQRQKSRDFALSVSPTSPIPHENCSSLRDQFLKIKERFSAPSPVGGATSPTSSSSPNAVRVASPTSAASGERRLSSSSLLPASVSTERLLVELNERAKRGYTGDLLWPNHAHVERWYVEDNYFRGSMTCWSMEKGAEVIARIARVISSRTSSSAPTATSPTNSTSASRYNPDVSLQWIGRQLWAVTVSLPLTRSGELTVEHANIAQAIDDAIAEEVQKAPQECGPRATASVLEAAASSSPASPAARTSGTTVCMNPLLERLAGDSGADEPSSYPATLPLDLPTCLSGAVVTADVAFESDQVPRSGDTATAEDAPQDDVSRTTHEADRRAVASDSSVSTVLGEDEPRQEDESVSTRSQTTQEDGDTLSALPLSLSMLSFTSLQSLSSTGDSQGLSGFSGSGGDHLQLHNGCAKDDDPLHRVPPDKTGWLKKKNGLNSWQPRYFELKGNRLFYFASESEGIPRGAIVLDHAHVLRGKGNESMTFTISASSGAQNLQMIKFSSRMTSQVHPRKSCVLRVVQDSEDAIGAWITAINRASFYCHLSTNSSASGSSNSVTQSSSSTASSSPTRKKKTPFYRLRSPSSSASSAEDEPRTSSGSSSPATIDSASYHHYSSAKYLQDTDPLLWEIHPHDQQKIRKKASIARTRSDYLSILTKYSSTFRQIFLPRPRPITIEQTLRDILPELFLINNVLYGGGDENNGLENIFEVLDGCIKKFASAQDERVRAVSALLQACARTISGGDSYFVVHSLLGNPSMIIRPAEARGHPIEIDVSTTNPSQFCITVFSAFSFHHIQDVENYGDSSSDGSSMPEPLLRVHTYHVQEFDFANGKSTRWLRIRTDGMKDDHDAPTARVGATTGSGSSGGGWMSKRTASETGFGALLDALS